MRFIDLFAGIGGMTLGLTRAGMEPVAFVEADPFRQSVLRKHWPQVPVFGDIREVNEEVLKSLGAVDLVAGSPPCQPFSVAGKRKGTADDRYLWPEMLRVVKILRPTWVLFENVAGIIGMALDTVLSDLESEGYEAAALVVPACAVGAPHRRDRVWIVAHTGSTGWQERNPASFAAAPGLDTRRVAEDVAHAEGTERQRAGTAWGRGDGLADGGGRDDQSGVGRNSPRLPGWLDGHRWPAPFGCGQYDWEPPRLTQGKIPYRRKRLMALGDAVVPQVVEVIGRAILEANRETM